MSKTSQHGLTLVELMIALTLSLLLLTGVVTLFLQSKNSFNQNSKIAQMQDEARFALAELSNDISMGGYWSAIPDETSIINDTSLTIATDCGPVGAPWVYDLAEAVTSVDNATGAQANAAHSCINALRHESGTDVISIKRMTGSVVGAPDINAVYLKSNLSKGLLLQHPEDVPAATSVPAPFTYTTYRPVVYYIRNHGSDRNTSDGIPTLCKKYLNTSAAPSMTEECLAQGVEDLQFEFGLDTDGNGVIDQYLAAPTNDELQRVISVRIFLLVRSAVAQTGYVNDKTYRISNRPNSIKKDGFYRRLYSTTVMVRNARNRMRFGS